ncbi:MAG: hypothetical protein IKA22_03675 [Lentisphaeria bacterium]|nr:hypothetical protein [Lentisphaeria bacterium]
MIVPMKKVTLLVLKKYELEAVGKLKKLGVMHIEHGILKDSKDRVAETADFSAMEKTVNALSVYKGVYNETKALAEFGSGEGVYERASAVLDENEKLNLRKEELARDIQSLEMWGNFHREDLDAFKAGGLFVYLCLAQEKLFREIKERFSDCAFETVSSARGQIAFVVISVKEIAAKDLPLSSLPRTDASLSELKTELKKTVRQLKINHQILLRCGKALPLMQKYMAVQQEKIEFMQVRDAMKEYGELAVLNGFVPAPDFEELEKLASASGWGLLAEDADAEKEAVPTKLEVPKWVKTIKPLFDFLAISPGYNELDVSGAVLIFFTLFFGILIGDAGYGALFFIISLIGFLKNRSNPSSKAVCKLIMILSCAAIGWGAATGNYFGTALLPGIAHLTESAVKDQNTQLVCFFLGFVQICVGHFWRAVIDMKWRNVGAQLGWVLVMIGNFILVDKMLVNPGAYPVIMVYFYAIGILLIAICEVNWKDAGSIFGFPSNIINSFVDLLSYIRLFAVGMAGYYLAFSFNMMAESVMKTGFIGIIAGIVILLLGHSLNIALAILSVLVHGVRLNTLEFSNHVGLQWAGFAYKPFAEKEELKN